LFLKSKSKSQGVTVIEALVGIALVSLVVMTIYATIAGVMRNIGEAKHRTEATALANEKMEIIRNIPYSQIGTVGGIVSGPLVADEDVTKNNFTYRVVTDIRYVDDDFDGRFPEDVVSNDYKQAQIVVEWQDARDQTKSVEFFSDFVPHGLETNEGGGVLSINTINSLGEVVPNVTVRLESIEDEPAIDTTVNTDDVGGLILSGTPSQTYQVTLTKTGYATERTYSQGSYIPSNGNIFVVEGELNTKTFIIDESGDLTIKAVDIADDSGIEGVEFELEGGRQIGSDPDTYNVTGTETTNSDGEINLSNTSPGSYSINNLEALGTSDFEYLDTDEDIPIQLSAGEEKEANFLFAEKNINSLVVAVTDGETESPVEGAEVHLVGEDFDQTTNTGASGRIYFSGEETEMNTGDYQLSVTISGYQSYSEAISISDLTKEEIELNEN
jgi:5-hydroxyisourate hydrolase-like protein (transthyretin family)